jgi:predicted DNA-binding protein
MSIFTRRASDTSPLVLRTVYLPQEDDERLKRFGLRARRSKNDLIREAVSKQLEIWEAEVTALDAAVQPEPAGQAAVAAMHGGRRQ